MLDTQNYRPVKQQSLRGFQLQPRQALDDIVQGAGLWRIWLSLSWQEFVSTYRRSIIGVFWVMLSFAAFVFIKLTIFSSLLGADDVRYYDAYLVIGFFMWVYAQQAIMTAPDTFVSAGGWIRSEALPLSTYIYKMVMREIYNLAFTFAVVVIALIYLQYPVGIEAAYSFLAVLFLLMNAFAIKLLLGIIGARMRDLSHLVKAIMLPMMFLTPIFWLPSQMPDLMKVLWWNPLFHAIEIFRAPILDKTFPTESWIFMGVVFAIVASSGFLLFARLRQRIVFWF